MRQWPRRLRRLSPVDLVLNLVFAVWVLHVVATGSVVPTVLLRSAPDHKATEVIQPAEEQMPLLPPIDLPEDS
ncbi:MAG TPA: hypothetical protein VNN10_03860 [Dehalococcoidia bacterium]|nr:hypothetical protein [Dehalococcoidia bacterium]